MSKTNHRIYKERPSREDESIAHKKRRKAKQLVSDYIEQYELYVDDDMDIDEFFLEDTLPVKKKPLKDSWPLTNSKDSSSASDTKVVTRR